MSRIKILLPLVEVIDNSHLTTKSWHQPRKQFGLGIDKKKTPKVYKFATPLSNSFEQIDKESWEKDYMSVN